MIEDRSVWIGDRVAVPIGEGNVEDVETWRSCIEGMRASEAVEFSARCAREVGVDFRTSWARVLVNIDGKRRWWPIASVRVIEGRDGKTRNNATS